MNNYWLNVQGYDSDGPTIYAELQKMVSGKLDVECVCELLANLVRESSPSSAAYPALPILLGDLTHLSSMARLYAINAAAMIVGLGNVHDCPEDPQIRALFDDDHKVRLAQRLFTEAGKNALADHDAIAIAATILALYKRIDLYNLID